MAEEQTMTRAAWERERAAELASKNVTDLASKVAELEFDLRAKRAELDTAKTQLPPEGSVILKGADKDRWEAYSALGKPDDLKTALADRDTLTARMAQRERQDSINAAAEAAGYKASVLGRLAPDGVTFEVREIEADGKKAKAAFVKDAEGKETPLSDFVSSNFADFLPALTVSAAPADQRSNPQFPKQETAASRPGPVDPVQARIDARKAQAAPPPDPLRPHPTGGI